MKWGLGGTPTTHLKVQLRAISVNFLILPAYQLVWDHLSIMGYTKVTTGNLEPLTVVRDIFLWMLVFELTW